MIRCAVFKSLGIVQVSLKYFIVSPYGHLHYQITRVQLHVVALLQAKTGFVQPPWTEQQRSQTCLHLQMIIMLLLQWGEAYKSALRLHISYYVLNNYY